ncbi:cation diffusion facilitator family transporter [Thioclava sp. GXIMD4216]|uniref:Cation diffusion facilitator family transporter n=1 Tax=Thioclava litoralis TaxID=3076557 RepID=A0ABZ1DWK3_9RHOB|nr:cation diffusion facilitator family transporter [Thioclava sp. FTW29]
MYDSESVKLNSSAGLASVAVAMVLVGLKAWALWQTGAVSIGASLADSAMDLLISVLGLITILYAAKPADHDHAFGHGSAEDLVSLGQALFVAASSGIIIWTAVERLLMPAASYKLEAEGTGIAIMIFSVLLTLVLVWWQGRVAKSTGNKVVAADRLHYVGDMIPALGAVFALWASKSLGWHKVDAVVALLAALVMLKGAWTIGTGGWNALMDGAVAPEIVKNIRHIASTHPGVRAFHDLKTRTAGATMFVQLHVELDGEQTLEDAHEIAARLKHKIIDTYPNADVIIHKDVWRSGK